MPAKDIAPRFDLSAGERALLEQAAAIAASHVPVDGESMSLPALRAIFRELQPTGYLGSVLPSEAGGKGLSPLVFAALVEGLAPDLTLLGNHSVQRYLHSFGSATQCRRFMPGLLSGEDVGAIAITEAQAGSDLARIETVARRAGDRYVLNGRKTWVTHGMVASTFIVLARTGDAKEQFTRFIVPGDNQGLQRYQQRPVGLTHLSFAHLEFHDCEIDAELRLGEEGQGLKGAKEAFPIARVLAALQALRVGRAALALGSDFARARVVASQSLADSSLVQHGYSDLSVRCEATRLLCFKVAANLTAPDATAMASAVKAAAGDLALDACRWASDCMGSAGLGADHRLVRLHNDARMMSVVDGTSVLNHLVAARRSIARRSSGQGSVDAGTRPP
jgi:alkylation response protein AidB-like acyl-CoA dehydrogenase